MRTIIFKLISIVVLITFLCQNVAWADSLNSPQSIVHSPQMLDNIYIPEQYGRVDKQIRNDPLTRVPRSEIRNSPLVILVKDAHCNYEAQRNIAKILDILIKDYGIDLVGVEGAGGKVDPSVIAGSPDAKKRKEVADKYLKKGWLTASEVLAMEKGKDYGFSIYGVEDLRLYLNDLKAFRDVYKGSEGAERFIQIAGNLILSLKNKLYAKDVLDFDKKIKEYKENKLPLTELIRYLYSIDKAGFVRYPNLRLVLKAILLEEAIDFNKVESERAALIRECEKRLPKEEIEQLVQKSLLYKLGKICSLEYYKYLEKQLLLVRHCLRHCEAKPKQSPARLLRPPRRTRNDRESFSNLIKYIQSTKLHSTIDEDELFNGLDTLIEDIYKRYITDEIAWKFHAIDKKIHLLRKLNRLEITRDELNECRQSGLTIDNIKEFLKIQGGINNITIPSELNDESFFKEVDNFYRYPDEFYRYALERDSAIIENLIAKMKTTNKEKAVLVVGGFHADGAERLLNERGIQVVTITPSITKEDPEAKRIYLERMMDSRIQPEKMFSEIGANSLAAPVETGVECPWWESYQININAIRNKSLSDIISGSQSAREAAEKISRLTVDKRQKAIDEFLDVIQGQSCEEVVRSILKKAMGEGLSTSADREEDLTGTRAGHDEYHAIGNFSRTIQDIANELGISPNERNEYDIRGFVEKQPNKPYTYLNGMDNTTILRIEEDGILTIIDERFQRNHAGRRRFTVYASSEAKAVHELIELRAWISYAKELGFTKEDIKNGKLNEWIAENIQKARRLRDEFHNRALIAEAEYSRIPFVKLKEKDINGRRELDRLTAGDMDIVIAGEGAAGVPADYDFSGLEWYFVGDEYLLGERGTPGEEGYTIVMYYPRLEIYKIFITERSRNGELAQNYYKYDARNNNFSTYHGSPDGSSKPDRISGDYAKIQTGINMIKERYGIIPRAKPIGYPEIGALIKGIIVRKKTKAKDVREGDLLLVKNTLDDYRLVQVDKIHRFRNEAGKSIIGVHQKGGQRFTEVPLVVCTNYAFKGKRWSRKCLEVRTDFTARPFSDHEYYVTGLTEDDKIWKISQAEADTIYSFRPLVESPPEDTPRNRANTCVRIALYAMQFSRWLKDEIDVESRGSKKVKVEIRESCKDINRENYFAALDNIILRFGIEIFEDVVKFLFKYNLDKLHIDIISPTPYGPHSDGYIFSPHSCKLAHDVIRGTHPTPINMDVGNVSNSKTLLGDEDFWMYLRERHPDLCQRLIAYLKGFPSSYQLPTDKSVIICPTSLIKAYFPRAYRIIHSVEPNFAPPRRKGTPAVTIRSEGMDQPDNIGQGHTKSHKPEPTPAISSKGEKGSPHYDINEKVRLALEFKAVLQGKEPYEKADPDFKIKLDGQEYNVYLLDIDESHAQRGGNNVYIGLEELGDRFRKSKLRRRIIHEIIEKEVLMRLTGEKSGLADIDEIALWIDSHPEESRGLHIEAHNEAKKQERNKELQRQIILPFEGGVFHKVLNKIQVKKLVSICVFIIAALFILIRPDGFLTIIIISKLLTEVKNVHPFAKRILSLSAGICIFLYSINAWALVKGVSMAMVSTNTVDLIIVGIVVGVIVFSLFADEIFGKRNSRKIGTSLDEIRERLRHLMGDEINGLDENNARFEPINVGQIDTIYPDTNLEPYICDKDSPWDIFMTGDSSDEGSERQGEKIRKIRSGDVLRIRIFNMGFPIDSLLRVRSITKKSNKFLGGPVMITVECEGDGKFSKGFSLEYGCMNQDAHVYMKPMIYVPGIGEVETQNRVIIERLAITPRNILIGKIREIFRLEEGDIEKPGIEEKLGEIADLGEDVLEAIRIIISVMGTANTRNFILYSTESIKTQIIRALVIASADDASSEAVKDRIRYILNKLFPKPEMKEAEEGDFITLEEWRKKNGKTLEDILDCLQKIDFFSNADIEYTRDKLKEVAEKLGLQPGQRYLHVGASCSRVVILLALYGVKCTYLDISRMTLAPLEIELNRTFKILKIKNPPVEFVLCNIDSVDRERPDLAGKFDVITMFHLFLHFKGNPDSAIRNLVMLIKDGGTIWFTPMTDLTPFEFIDLVPKFRKVPGITIEGPLGDGIKGGYPEPDDKEVNPFEGYNFGYKVTKGSENNTQTAEQNNGGRGYGGEENVYFTPKIREALGVDENGKVIEGAERNFACVTYNKDAEIVKETLTMDEGGEISGELQLDGGERANLQAAINSLSKELPEEDISIIFIPGIEPHYGVPRAQIYLDKILLADGQMDALRRRLRHELKERQMGKEGMRPEEAHRQLVIEELSELLGLDKKKVAKALKGESLRLLHTLRELLTVDVISEDELRDRLQVIFESAEKVVGVIDMIKKDIHVLPANVRKIQETLAMYVAIDVLKKQEEESKKKEEESKKDQYMPCFMKELKRKLRAKGLDEVFVNDVIKEIERLEGFYIDKSGNVIPSPYFEIMLSTLLTMMPDAKGELETLWKYKRAKVEVRIEYRVGRGRAQGVEPDVVASIVSTCLRKGSITEGMEEEFVEVIARYKAEKEEFLKMFDDQKKKLVEKGIDNILGRSRRDILKGEIMVAIEPLSDGENLDGGVLSSAIKGLEKLRSRLESELPPTEAQIDESIPDVIDASLLLGDIKKEEGKYTFEAYGEAIVGDLQEMARNGTLRILYSDDNQKGAVGRWLKSKEITKVVFIQVNNAVQELECGAVWMLSPGVARNIEGQIPKNGRHKIVRGRGDPVDNDLILMSRTRNILKLRDDTLIRNELEKLYRAYYLTGGIPEEEIDKIVQEIIGGIRKGGLIVIELPPALPVMKVFMLMLKNTREILGSAA